MMKLSDYPESKGRNILLKAQKRGVEVCGPIKLEMDATVITLIGLVDILSEHNTGGINDIVKNMESAEIQE